MKIVIYSSWWGMRLWMINCFNLIVVFETQLFYKTKKVYEKPTWIQKWLYSNSSKHFHCLSLVSGRSWKLNSTVNFFGSNLILGLQRLANASIHWIHENTIVKRSMKHTHTCCILNLCMKGINWKRKAGRQINTYRSWNTMYSAQFQHR